ncbi:cell division protein DivIVA [Bifidobacterium dolichotidis]|uniref:Cell division protein DivIVA n=1 Tax=Bifidobacterium dolichotidis TaxID=2306976 RepID=A0A430FS28_9BIFI|nr:DivIVA domain-containing protein [Bifidobacterium dolichotidis]RSX55647.1 cell division protein DivIVA [Bifidobacterium dolichotidis]
MAMMSQDQQTSQLDERDSVEAMPSLPRVKKRQWGYDPAQVDEFLEQAHMRYEQPGMSLMLGDIQNASFDLVKGGYRIDKVDQTLNRLAKAVADKITDIEITTNGRVTWKAQTERLFRTLDSHAQREEGERFAPGAPRMPSYDRKQVDALVDSILDSAEIELQEEVSNDNTSDDPASFEAVKPSVTATSVANTVFTQRRGKKGYDERQVDFFLNSCVELLSRLESFARLYGKNTGMQAPETAERVTRKPSLNEPNSLFANVPDADDAAQVASAKTEPIDLTSMAHQNAAASAPMASHHASPLDAVDQEQTPFDALQKAEQAIFATSQSMAAAAAAGAGAAGDAATSAVGSASAAAPSDGEATQVIGHVVPPSFAPEHVPEHTPAHAASSKPTTAPSFGQTQRDYDSTPAPKLTHVSESIKMAQIQPITPAPRTETPAERAAKAAAAAKAAQASAVQTPAPVQTSAPASASAAAPVAADQNVNSSTSDVKQQSDIAEPHHIDMFPTMSDFHVPNLDMDIPDLSFPSFGDDDEQEK